MELKTCRILQCRSRILVPFRVRRRGPENSCFAADEIAQVFREQGSGWSWQGPALHGTDEADATGAGDDAEKAAHSRYMLEYLEHAVKFLFDGTGETGCHYLRVAADPLALQTQSRSIWIGTGLEVKDAGGGGRNRPSPRGLELLARGGPWKKQQPPAADGDALRLAPLPKKLHAEIWLSRLGLGVLSIPLVIDPAAGAGSLELAGLCDLHHALATGQKYVWLGAPSGADGAVSGFPDPALGVTTRSQESGRPAVGGFGEVGRPVPSGRDGATHFHELARQLLVPLAALGELDCDHRGLVYAVVCVSAPQAGAADDAVRNELLGGLSQLAQLHPSGHPGGPAGDAALYLNNEHLAVIDLGGAAHAALVRTEYQRPADREFAEVTRPERCSREYFPGYLLAVLQRMCLQDLLNRAATEVSGESSRKDMEAIRRDALALSLEGEFIQVSWRGELQRFHELAQRVCEVQQGLQTVRDSLDGFDRMSQAHEAKERELESLRSERNMQMLEVFLVSVYAVEVAHSLGDSFQFPHNWFTGYSLIGVLLATTLTVIFQMTCGRQPEAELPQPKSKPRLPGFFAWAGWPLVGSLLLIHAVYLLLNFWFNPPQGH